MGRLNDYTEPLVSRTQPAEGLKTPFGPANFPIRSTLPQTEKDLLKSIYDELKAQNDSRTPVLRSSAVTDAGQTLDWEAVGVMDRVLIRNKGTNSVWITFDVNGPSVNAFTSDQSFELQPQESLGLPHCRFIKIGCRCAAGQTGLVHAIAFKASAGSFAGAIT